MPAKKSNITTSTAPELVQQKQNLLRRIENAKRQRSDLRALQAKNYLDIADAIGDDRPGRGLNVAMPYGPFADFLLSRIAAWLTAREKELAEIETKLAAK